MNKLIIVIKMLTAFAWREEVEFFRDMDTFLSATDSAKEDDVLSGNIDVSERFVNRFFGIIAAHLHDAKNYKSMSFSRQDTGEPIGILTLEKYNANSPVIENERLKQLLRDNGIDYETEKVIVSTGCHDEDEIMSIILSAAIRSNGCVIGSIDNGVLTIKEG